MLLKCRYLSQFSVAELAKNASSLNAALNQCPFMMHACRTLKSQTTDYSSTNGFAQPQQQLQVQEPEIKLTKFEEQPTGCTNTINCPFFQNSNLDLNKLIVEKNVDDMTNEVRHKVATKRHNRLNVTESHLEQVKHHASTKKQMSKNHLNANAKFLKEESKLFDYEKFFAHKISEKKQDGSYRYFKKVTRHAEHFPRIQEQSNDKVRDVTIWCSNDYLGLGRHPYVQNRITEAVMKYGAGSGGTRNISGSTPLHDKLERELAILHQKEAALLFTSCYVANDTTLFTMAKMLPNCQILSDAGNHASMIQGIRNSGVPKTIFRHNDYEHLEKLLSQMPASIPKIVAFESVHSMDGSICDMEKMCDVTHKYGGIAYIDEVHAVGLYGRNGAGIGERDNLLHKMDIITGTLGKAFGNIGGYVAGSAHLVDTMRSYGSGFIFTTSLPPSVASGALAAIEISRSDEGRELRRKHQLNASIVKQRLVEAGFPVMNSPSHIVPVMVGDVTYASEVCDRLMSEYGIYIQAINYPTVARGEERLRIVPNPHHTPEMIDYLVESLTSVWQRVGLRLNANNIIKKQV